jgi:poly(A) polymerase
MKAALVKSEKSQETILSYFSHHLVDVEADE